MKRWEAYACFLIILASVGLSYLGLWVKLDLNQTASRQLIITMDENSKEREAAMQRQIQAGLDKSDALIQADKNISEGSQTIAKAQTEILSDIRKLLNQHTQPIERAARASQQAADSAKASANATKKAVRAIEHEEKKPLIERIFK